MASATDVAISSRSRPSTIACSMSTSGPAELRTPSGELRALRCQHASAGLLVGVLGMSADHEHFDPSVAKLDRETPRDRRQARSPTRRRRTKRRRNPARIQQRRSRQTHGGPIGDRHSLLPRRSPPPQADPPWAAPAVSLGVYHTRGSLASRPSISSARLRCAAEPDARAGEQHAEADHGSHVAGKSTSRNRRSRALGRTEGDRRFCSMPQRRLGAAAVRAVRLLKRPDAPCDVAGDCWRQEIPGQKRAG